MKDTFAMVYAEPGNPLLGDLIAHRCVAALPVGGRFRAIDFLLSNLSTSGIKDVGVITQRNFQSLDEHIGSGDAWDLAVRVVDVTAGVFFCLPRDHARQQQHRDDVRYGHQAVHQEIGRAHV